MNIQYEPGVSISVNSNNNGESAEYCIKTVTFATVCGISLALGASGDEEGTHSGDEVSAPGVGEFNGLPVFDSLSKLLDFLGRLVGKDRGDVTWIPEKQAPSPAGLYEDGAAGAHDNMVTKVSYVPELSYVNLKGEISDVKFDGFDEVDDVLIHRKWNSVYTTEKVQRGLINQSLALEQNGYTGRWEVQNKLSSLGLRGC